MEDLIRRSDAKDAVIEWYGCKPNDIEAFEKIIEAIPSAESTGDLDNAIYEYVKEGLMDNPYDRPQEWIPCSERKPTKAGHYLCSLKKSTFIDNINVNLAYWTGGRWYGYLASEINAWMPLPEPWKGADDDNL